ncbi:class I SAM-dependent methyltransferase [uncultured Gemmiger sp.]|uniref:class I SAM-dependent methyltransferase n=1 Tax=uncultured Gemmiger sp. TaxID=1623490 RepID=UPI0025F3D88A|nr:class I SAM-dependent methyltransferase [uncultured Gemmiger sp.]
MLDNQGFNLWAQEYDGSVRCSDENNRYPFAGYQDIMDEIFRRVLSAPGRDILDIGFGTGVLTARLYEQGCRIFGQDFSSAMIELAQQKMPEAILVQGNFAQGLAVPLRQNRYDAILATYSLHHLTDAQKVSFLHDLLSCLREGGCLYIGDVAFTTRRELEACRAKAGDSWDDDEIYFVFDELKSSFPTMQFEPFSYCSGLLSLKK